MLLPYISTSFLFGPAWKKHPQCGTSHNPCLRKDQLVSPWSSMEKIQSIRPTSKVQSTT